MPIVRCHQSTDGQLHRTYEEYAQHQEGLNFDRAWEEKFASRFHANAEGDVFDEQFEEIISDFIHANLDELESFIKEIRVKRTTGNKKSKK